MLVGVHIAGATAVCSATVALYLGMFERRPVARPDGVPASIEHAPARPIDAKI